MNDPDDADDPDDRDEPEEPPLTPVDRLRLPDPPADVKPLLDAGACTDGRDGVETVGAWTGGGLDSVTGGGSGLGIETVGTEIVGVETDGTETLGVDTDGTFAVGVDTDGTDTLGTVRAGLECGGMPTRRTANAASSNASAALAAFRAE
jgi:hypothetical protein